MNNRTPYKITPSDEILEQLGSLIDQRDYRRYGLLMNQVNWQEASAGQLNQGIDLALAFTDLGRAKLLTTIGLERFPEDDMFKQTWRLFTPAPARVIQSNHKSSPDKLRASMEWLRNHAHDYELGYWLAVKSGQLIASAPTLNELDAMIETIGGPEILATDAVIHQVIA